MTNSPALGTWPDVPPKAHQLVEVIRKLAQNSANVSWLKHAQERLIERDITDRDALRVLRMGEMVGPIEPGGKRGEWKCKLCFPQEYQSGSREVGVVTIVQQTTRLLIKTVEWENFR